ncbi:DUF3054 domain-containing protein [Corynebacterium halotolerans]|uniref:DUF3054 domain-containing protein n=1 Tax=Corynebacterium halotolerans TaxID=225326 RepID=UPI003CF0C515
MKVQYPALALDVVAIAVFALLARLAHQSEDMPFTFVGWLSTLWPFLVGVAVSWIVILLARWNALRVWPVGVATWIITAVVGLVIWGIRNNDVPHWSFIIVAVVMSGILLLGWRGLAKLKK